MAQVFNYNSWVWIPHDELMYRPAKVIETFKSGDKARVSVDGEELILTKKQTKRLLRMDGQSNSPIQDMVELRELNEAALLHNLRLRFAADEIYTSVGQILVSVNPFKLLKVYTDEYLEAYRDKGHREMPPHVFGIADIAYSDMTRTGQNQSCIVSGESGAGKTEATKIFLQYIAEVSEIANKGQNSKTDGGLNDGVSLQEQILKSNPLLEAFGNAKTVRNDNSSRFGKWIEIKMNNKKGTIIGGRIVQYLLEKSRLVTPQPGERNYHIFYNLCAGAALDPTVKEKFRIMEARDYSFLAMHEDSLTVEGINDERDWEDVIASMEVMGFSHKEQDDILRTLAAILHLGNLEFQEAVVDNAEGSRVVNREMLELAASQLGTKADKLEKALCTSDISNSRETQVRYLRMEDAMGARDVMAKTIYASLFSWLVDRINLSLEKNTGILNERLKGKSKMREQDISIIGVLDIFGFESFEHNSFEQVCINYCNEKLQYHFNNHIFKLEEALYKQEGIDVSHISFKDNLPTLELFENKNNGVFAILDETMFMPNGSDSSFLKTITQKQKSHPNFRGPGIKLTKDRKSFTILHYAGEVSYVVDGFLEKNSDKVSKDVQSLVSQSTITFVKNLMQSSAEDMSVTKTKIRNRKKGASLGTKFKDQLGLLMNQINDTSPHYIRCIKPNKQKVGGIFEASLVLDQLNYAGVLEVCRIRKVGYSVRKDFNEFLFRYSCIAQQKILRFTSVEQSKDAVKRLCETLVGLNSLTMGEFQVGKSKVFMRNSQVDKLESGRDKALQIHILNIQKTFRTYLERKKFARFKEIRRELKSRVNDTGSLDADMISAAIDGYRELPYQGSHLKELKEAKLLLEKLKEIKKVTKLLSEAISKRDLNLLKSSIGVAEQALTAMGKDFSDMDFNAELDSARELVSTIEAEAKSLEELKVAMKARDLGAISVALNTVMSLGLSGHKVTQQAEILRAQLEEEERILRNISHAVTAQNLETLRAALNAAEEMGMESREEVVNGRKVKDELIMKEEVEQQERIKEEEAKKQEEMKVQREKKLREIEERLVRALKEQDFDQVNDLRGQALVLGMQAQELDKYFKTADDLVKVNKHNEALDAVMKSMKVLQENKNGITLEDISPLTQTIEKAKGDGIKDDMSSFLRNAIDMEEAMKMQVDVQEEIRVALEGKVYDQLKIAIERAEELNLKLELVDQAKELLKEAPTKHIRARVPSHYSEETEGNDSVEDIMKNQRNIKFKVAEQSQFYFTKYYKIRTDGDYVSGVYFNKKKLIESKLSYQKTPIAKSLLSLEGGNRKETGRLNKMAINVNKSILGYCGERTSQFPATLAQDILYKGIEEPELVDEIYIQLFKHLVDNPYPESIGRTWQLICMVVGTFPPSEEFDMFVLNFLLSSVKNTGLVSTYATYALRRIEGMLIKGTSAFVLGINEILAYKVRPPVVATICLVDDTPISINLPVAPDLEVARVVDICKRFLMLQEAKASQFGIFVTEEPIDDSGHIDALLPASHYSAIRRPGYESSMMSPPGDGDLDGDMPPPPPPAFNISSSTPPKSPAPLRETDFLGDVIVHKRQNNVNHKFIYKKKLFAAEDNDEESEDEYYRRLIYLQAADSVLSGEVPIKDEKQLLLLTAIAMKSDADPEGKDVFPAAARALLDMDLMNYIPDLWKKKKTELNWARAVGSTRGKVLRKTPVQLEQEYIKLVRGLPCWGMHFFFVRKEMNGSDLKCGIDAKGISFFNLQMKKLQFYPFEDIQKWGGSSTIFWMLVLESKKTKQVRISVFTGQARAISGLILDYNDFRKRLRVAV